MPEVELEVVEHVATLTLNRPKVNSISSSLLAALYAAVTEVERSDAVRAVIVTGAGRMFSAGADIEEISRLDAESGQAFALRGHAVFARIEALNKPVVAAVNGDALGGGSELALACHWRLASQRASFGQPEVKLGLLPGFGGTQRLPRLIGRGMAAQLVVTGEPIGADEALRVGLVNEVVEPHALLNRARALLAGMNPHAESPRGPRAVAAALNAIRDGLELPPERALELEAERFGALCGSDEMREGTRAFLERRRPQF